VSVWVLIFVLVILVLVDDLWRGRNKAASTKSQGPIHDDDTPPRK
jgi:hypothetical protein